MQMKVDSEQRTHLATMRANESKDANKRRKDECKEAARLREDDRNDAARVRADERSKRAKDWTAAISLISGIASGYFTMTTEVQGGKRKRLAKNRET